MHIVKKNFDKKQTSGQIFATGILLCALCVSMPAYAAADNGCMNEDNDRITPELALCSTHVYNIGATTNPSNETDKQLMRDVVALKTTVMTQQMKKQYDYLEATIRRFKTQLEKAILTTKLQAAGAADDSTSNGGISKDRNIVLIGAENCMLKGTTSAGLQCIQSNIRIVLQAVSAGNVGEAYRQLQKDLGFAKSYSVKCGETYECDAYDQCKNLKASRDNVNNCAYQLNIAVMQKIEAIARQQQGNRQGQQSSF